MINPESEQGERHKKLYDWNVPVNDDEHRELLDELMKKTDEDVEANHPASRPPMPAYVTMRILRNKRRRLQSGR